MKIKNIPLKYFNIFLRTHKKITTIFNKHLSKTIIFARRGVSESPSRDVTHYTDEN